MYMGFHPHRGINNSNSSKKKEEEDEMPFGVRDHLTEKQVDLFLEFFY